MKNETVRSNVPKTTICARRSTRPAPVGPVSQLHYHDELEFLPVYTGLFACTVDGVDYVAGPGQVIFINSGIPHSTHCLEESTSGLLQFRESDYLDTEVSRIVKYSVRFQGLDGAPARVIDDAELFNAVNDVLQESACKSKAYEIFIKSGILRLLGMLYRRDILSDSEQMYNTKEVQKILPVLGYVNANYYENITLEEASAKLNFDPSYFCRLFKTAIGATFTEYLNFVRVCKAEKLLSKTHDSILEISEAVGFSSVSYFNRIFKKYRNCSPRYYRSARYVAISKGERESEIR